MAECALDQVEKLIQSGYVGEIVLLNAVVVDLPWRELKLNESSPPTAFDYNAFKQTFIDKSKKYLARIQSRFTSWNIKVKTETIDSNGPSHTITDYAQKNGVDLILMATHML